MSDVAGIFKSLRKHPDQKWWDGPLGAAISSLDNDLKIVRNNEPINRKEGNHGQADLEKKNAESYAKAMKALKAIQDLGSKIST